MWILDHEIPGKYTNLKAHSSLAIASISSKNELLISSGISILDKIPISKSITSKEWHQENKHLLLAWDDASISVYDAQDKSMVDGKLHSSPVTQMEWLSEGSKFITVDTDNHVVVWKYDARKRLSVLVEYRMSHLIAKILIINGSSKDPMTFYMVCNDGIVYYADDSGHCQQLSQTFPSNIQEIYHIPAKALIIAITRDFVIAKMSIENDGKLRQNQVIKLGLRSNSDFLIALIHDEALLISSPEQPLRVYNFSSDDSSILTIPLKMEDSELITSLDWKKENCLLLATTSKGIIYIWKIADTQRPWQMLQTISGENEKCTAHWGRNDDLFVKRNGEVQIYTSRIRQYAIYGNFYAIQTSGTKVLISNDHIKHVVQSKNLIKRISLCDEAFGIWTGLFLELYKFSADSVDSNPCIKLAVERSLFAVHKSGIYIAAGNVLEVYNFSGFKKHTILAHELSISSLALGQKILAIIAGEDLKIYDIQRREPRLIATKSLSTLSNIRDIKVNMDSSFISIQGMVEILRIANLASSGSSSSQLFFYDIQNDNLLNYSFSDDAMVSKLVWDASDPRLFVCEVETKTSDSIYESKIFSMYITDSEIGDLNQYFTPHSGSLFLSDTPHHIFLTEGEDQDKIENIILKQKVHNYENVTEGDASMTKTITDFSIFLKLGNIDEAVRTVRFINNSQIWKTLARMSIKSKRLDIARLCLSKIGDAKALRSLRELEAETDESKFGLVAISLGLYDEAQDIYESKGRKDLVNNLYQYTGKWESSLDSENSIGQRKEFFKYASYLSSIGDIIGAIAAFEKAGNSHIHIPRMLYKMKKLNQLKEYIDAKEDANLYKWWAQYMESTGSLQESIKYYEKANDTLSLSRMYCFVGDMEKAVSLIESTNNVTAAYHLARYCEDNNMPIEAVNYYAKSNCYGNAIEVCKEHKLDGELMRLALQGSVECMRDVAKYFESIEDSVEKAIVLYRKCGAVGKAISLCFHHKLYQSLSEIIMHEKVNPTVLEKCAALFMKAQMYDKAMYAYFNCGQPSEALRIATEHKVLLSEELVENLVSEEIANLLMSQKHYILACKKYIQLGQKLKAMQALLRSGDKEKILYFANILGRENPDIYVMAANYLQSLDWRSDLSILKAIITLYTKAKSWESLVSFYSSCAEIEVLNYSNYSQAIAANKEALKYALKTGSTRISDLEKTIQYQSILVDREEESLLPLLNDPSLTRYGVKVEDVSGILLGIYYRRGDMDRAADLLQRQPVDNIPEEISGWLNKGL